VVGAEVTVPAEVVAGNGGEDEAVQARRGVGVQAGALEGGEFEDDVVGLVEGGGVQKKAVPDIAAEKSGGVQSLEGKVEEGGCAALSVGAGDSEGLRRGTFGEAFEQEVDLLACFGAGCMAVLPLPEERMVGGDGGVEDEEIASFQRCRAFGKEAPLDPGAAPVQLLKARTKSLGGGSIHDCDLESPAFQFQDGTQSSAESTQPPNDGARGHFPYRLRAAFFAL